MKSATDRRDLAEIDRLLASQAQVVSPARRQTMWVAFWLIWPVTLLEGALMAVISVLLYWCWRITYSRRWYPDQARQRPSSLVKQTIDSENALGVMQTVERIARESGARMYWISGTLLGLERLGQPLPHDNDMDAGIDIADPHFPVFLRAMWASSEVVAIAPQFISLKARIQNPDLHVVPGGIIRYKAAVRNESAPGKPPVKTDIFLHFDYCGGSMHGTRNSLWWNTAFRVVQKTFAKGNFSVPEDAHLHLTENYGDYRSEVKDFENSIDCPNAMNIFSWNSLAYLVIRQKMMLKLGRIGRAGQIAARIRATILKGVFPPSQRDPKTYLGS